MRPARIPKTIAKPTPKPQPWLRDRNHLAWVRTLPCLSCGARPPCEAAHVRLYTDGAMGRKPSDFYVIPLCATDGFAGCHFIQHGIGEAAFYADLQKYGIADPWSVALRLYRISGQTEAGFRTIAKARPGLRTAEIIGDVDE